MRSLVSIAIAAFVALPVLSGDIRLTWEPGTGTGPTPTGYKVYWGTVSPPDDPANNELDVGNVLFWEVSDGSLADCVTTYYGVRAYIPSLESNLSTEVSTYPRPHIVDVVNSGIGTHTIMGTNFDTNLKVFIDAGSGWTQIPSDDVNRVDCTKIEIPDIPLFRVQVSNVALPLGSGEPKNIFSQPWPGPVVSVE
jgi:hypothetical protein